MSDQRLVTCALCGAFFQCAARVRYAMNTINHAAEAPSAHPAGAEEVKAKTRSSSKP